ncbi:MAG: glycoside hydrolase family 2 TIM barrel-domain containing protein, partial [Spirochaetota bacterium]
YWPDGLYTPPSDEAMIYDIRLMKDMGFNMLRKHIKIEPLRWYYHCDRLGMIVWQDMINGGGKYSFWATAILPFIGINFKDNRYRFLARRSKEGRTEYYRELKEMIDLLYNVPSIAVWVPFNEAWGQFDSITAAEFIRQRDAARIIDHASGWYDQGGGDLKSLHIYFRKVKIPADRRTVVLSEFGGYSLGCKGHVFNPDRPFGYKKFDDAEKFMAAYEKLFEEDVIANIPKGLSASVYTQLSDVEDEINGLVSYDRKVVKVDIEKIKEINGKIKL